MTEKKAYPNLTQEKLNQIEQELTVPESSSQASDIPIKGTGVKDDFVSMGDRLMGTSFNPSGNPDIDNIKEHMAYVMNKFIDSINGECSDEKQKLISLALDQMIIAKMCIVNALTYKY
jgi:hypothetical protein